jgi:site-specific recombinase XerD
MKNKLITRFYLNNRTIYLRLTINGERAEVSTNSKTNPVQWSKSLQRVKGKDENSFLINASLNILLAKVMKLYNNLDMNDESVSLHQILAGLKGKKATQITLFKTYDYHIANITKLIGIDFTATTIKRYKSSFASLKRYLNNTDIKLCDLNYKFISDFHTYLKTTEKLQHNSATNIIKNLYRVINVAVRNNWLPNNPFSNFSCNYINPTRNYLTESEIDTLVDKVFSIDRLTKVRDAFVFQIYTGLSFTDMESLTTENIEVGVDGKQWIIINRRKTGVRSAVPILPRALVILQKYEYKLPVCSNQRMNGYLKEIADLCDIKKTLTTHIARHTFATTITLSQGVPIETVSKMLGHSDIRTTQIYAKVTDRKVAKDMQSLT